MDKEKQLAKLEIIRQKLCDKEKLLSTLLPNYLSPERQIALAYNMVARNPGLQKCTTDSLIMAVIAASELGFELTGPLGHAYLVPRWNKNLNGFEAQFQVGYMGYVHLAMTAGNAVSIVARKVYQGDDFEYQQGTDEWIKHTPAKEKKGELLYTYAVMKNDRGGTIFWVCNLEDIHESMHRSAMWDKEKKKIKGGPWETDFEAMALIVPVRRLRKWMVLSPAASKAWYRAERLDEPVVELPIGEIIDHEPGEVTEHTHDGNTKPPPEPDKKTESKKQEKKKDSPAQSSVKTGGDDPAVEGARQPLGEKNKETANETPAESNGETFLQKINKFISVLGYPEVQTIAKEVSGHKGTVEIKDPVQQEEVLARLKVRADEVQTAGKK